MSWSNDGDIWKDFEKNMAVKLGMIKEADIKPKRDFDDIDPETESPFVSEKTWMDVGEKGEVDSTREGRIVRLDEDESIDSFDEENPTLEQMFGEEDTLGLDNPEEIASEEEDEEEEMLADDQQIKQLRMQYEVARSQNNFELAEKLLRQYKMLMGQRTGKQAGALYYTTLRALYKLASAAEAAGVKSKDITGLKIGKVLDDAAEALIKAAKK